MSEQIQNIRQKSGPETGKESGDLLTTFQLQLPKEQNPENKLRGNKQTGVQDLKSGELKCVSCPDLQSMMNMSVGSGGFWETESRADSGVDVTGVTL